METQGHNMERILVTGLSGFIGGYLEKRLRSHYEIVDLNEDLLNYKAIQKRVADVDPDYIVHLAARTEVEKSFYEQITFSEINYVGTVNLIESARHLKNLKLFIFSSTMETYGWQPESDQIKRGESIPLPVFDEQTKQHPNAPYAVAKVACEYYLNYAHRSYGLPYTAFRQTNSYGRIDNDFFVVEAIITQMLKNPNEINLGYGDPYRNFLFIDDLIELYVAVLNNPDKAKGEIFCCGPNNALTIYDLANKIANMLDWKGKINWNTRPERPGEIYVLNSTPAKAERILGWTPKTSLEDGLRKTIDLWRNKLNG